MLFGVLAGVLLSWVELEWLRRHVHRLFSGETPAKSWIRHFAFRWGAVALTLAFFVQVFKSNLFPFLISFLLSNLILRVIYGRKAYA